MTFRVGQKVVCVKDCDGPPETGYAAGFRHGLRNGTIHTVLRTWVTAGHPMVEVSIVKGGWRQDRFRPIVERKTDIAIFKRMLNPTREETLAALEDDARRALKHLEKITSR